MNTPPHPTADTPTPLPGAPVSRRTALAALAGLGTALLAACSSDTKTATSTNPSSSTAATSVTTSSAASTATTASTTAATAATDLTRIPEETAGPYPGDGSNGIDVLGDSAIVRSDIRSSYGSSTTTADGVPLTIRLTIVDTDGAPRPGAAVYLWHCDRDGQYSLYTQAIAGENYLRGVSAAGDDGAVTFTSIFPGAYSGRWPHIHFEVFDSLDAARDSGNKIATSQIALPEDVCELAYATAGYEQSVRNLAGSSLATDNVFRDDGGVHELATVTGSVADGFIAALTVPV